MGGNKAVPEGAAIGGPTFQPVPATRGGRSRTPDRGVSRRDTTQGACDMNFGELRQWLNNRSRNTRGSAAGRKRARPARPGLEVLEDRAVPAVGLSVVNDNWDFVADNDGSNS